MDGAARSFGRRDNVQNIEISRLLDETRKRLVDTGTRNRLIHVNRGNARGNVINVFSERSDDVYSLLASGRTLRFRPADEDERRRDNELETRLVADALQKKLLKIHRDAKTAEEESGVSILYLALGFLTWFEDKNSKTPREAPLVLVPVELVRIAKTSTYDLRIREEDVVTNLPLQQRLMDDFGIALPDLDVCDDWRPSKYFAEVQALALQRSGWILSPDAIHLGFFSFSKFLMYRDLAMDSWPEGALADHPLTRGLLYEGFGTEEPLFGADDRLDEKLPPERLFHVVDADASQAKVIEEFRSGRNLVVQGPPGTGKSQTITNLIAAAARDGKRVLFVAEKMAALSVVHDRLVKVGLRDLCLELHSRKVSKKVVLEELARTIAGALEPPTTPPSPAALRESRDRLNAIAEALHAPIGTTGETAFSVLGLQVRFIADQHPAPRLDCDVLSTMSKDAEVRLVEIIEDYGAVLAAEGGALDNPFEGVGNLALQPVERARLGAELAEAAASADALLGVMERPLEALSPGATPSLDSVEPLQDLLARLGDFPAGSGGLAAAVMATPDLSRLSNALTGEGPWRALRNTAAKTFNDAAFELSANRLRGALVMGSKSFFARWGAAYRKASAQLAGFLVVDLPKSANDRIALVDALLEVVVAKKLWEADVDFCRAVLGPSWRGEQTDFRKALEIVAWCERLSAASMKFATSRALELAGRPDALDAIRRGLQQRAAEARDTVQAVFQNLQIDPNAPGGRSGSLHATSAWFKAMAEHVDRYPAWVNRARPKAAIIAAGLPALEARMARGALDGASAAVELRFARAERIWRLALDQTPVLRSLGDEKRHTLVARFAELERRRLKDNATEILRAHMARVPQGALGEMKIIRGELVKKRGQMALRRLLGSAGDAVQRIKPVFLMSPISVAQFIPPGALAFDILIIDEASQVRPEDALGAIARAKQIVVVGDKKQLPPSSFFARLLSDGDDDAGLDDDEAELGPDLLGGAASVAEMESILTLCEARGLGSRMLKWHYRSRDPSLIAVSNKEFYQGGLVLPPSPLQEDPAYGLCFTKVNGVYDKGGRRDNRKEGEAIVLRVAEHARKFPSLSLGIVTFSVAQRNLITELLDQTRQHAPFLDAFLREGQAEDLFVKNIENVQGDERDVILISVGYGPIVPGGLLTSMSFGPVNTEGGERRLNVLFTRARVRCEVFASFDPNEIDLSRTSMDGPRVLKRFLDFAKNGGSHDAAPVGEDTDSPIESDVADVIRSCGFLADPQLGSVGFKIDIGVRHPDRPATYLLAVECDGATYHSAVWARERDRLRQEVLEHLGWRFYRIWSTDWFYNRSAEVERLKKALLAAHEDAGHGIQVPGANQTRPPTFEDLEPEVVEVSLPDAVLRQMPSYTRAAFSATILQEPHEVPVFQLAPMVKRIVVAEGPIHSEEVARRLAACFGKERAGSRILSATMAALSRAKATDPDLLIEDGFWFTRDQGDDPPVRDRSLEVGPSLKASNISMMEIRAALRIANEDNAGGPDADLVRTAAKLLGFRRVGSDLQARISAGLS